MKHVVITEGKTKKSLWKGVSYKKQIGRKVSVPTDNSEVTYKQFYDFITAKEQDAKALIQCMTGIEPEYWDQKETVAVFAGILGALDFFDVPEKTECPQSVYIDDESYIIPEQIDFISAAAYLEATEQEINEDNIYENYPRLVAILLRESKGNYDGLEAKKLIDKVWNMSFLDVLGIGTFFLIKLLELKGGDKKQLRKLEKTIKRNRQGIMNYLKYLVGFVSWTAWQMVTRLSMKLF